AAMQQRVEVLAVGTLEPFLLAHVCVDRHQLAAANQPFVQALQREFAGTAPRRLATAGTGLGSHAQSSLIGLAISTGTRAASRPLSSTRAQACASLSTVRMALATGI